MHFDADPQPTRAGSVLLYKRGGGKKFIKQQGGGDGADDAADASSDSSQTVAERHSTRDDAGDAQEKAGKKEGEVEAADAVFTWKDLTYVRELCPLRAASGPRADPCWSAPQTVGNGIKLLDNVSGYCKVRSGASFVAALSRLADPLPPLADLRPASSRR